MKRVFYLLLAVKVVLVALAVTGASILPAVVMVKAIFGVYCLMVSALVAFLRESR